ncbi:MAG: carboxypeptidase regulatory-like domain-containing protein [Deltaproteobacteria bacterium]|nr:carboxypeptidase regulatory-like domain-containing protein [Deltaproteobacteria bacterium]
MNAFKALSVAGAVVALLSCAAEQKPIEITGAQAMGTVGGMVVSAVTREPLSGVSVTLLAGGVPTTATTDAKGGFSFPQVPSGEVSVILDHAEYLSALMHGYLLGAGEYPIDNASLTFGPIGLIPASGSFSALLIFDDGSPAGGVTLTARTTTRFYDYTDSYSASVSAQATTVSAATDATGLVKFTGLPDFLLLGDGNADVVSVIVPPIAEASGGPSLYRYPGGIFSYHMTAVGAITPTIVLERPALGALTVTASNLQSLEGAIANPLPSIIPRGGPLYIAFNQPLNPDATSIQLYEEGAPKVLARDQTAVVQKSISYNTIQLSFSPELTQSSEYNIIIHAVAGAADQLVRYDGWAPFFTEPTATMLKPAMEREIINALTHDEVIHLVFAEPIGTGNNGTNVFQNADCVLFFNVDLGPTAGGAIGDDPGETGNASCRGDLVLQTEEPDPPGPAGYSGYTKYWKFNLPVLPGPASVPVATPFSIVFSRVANQNYLMKRVNGQTVPDFVGTLNLVLP